MSANPNMVDETGEDVDSLINTSVWQKFAAMTMAIMVVITLLPKNPEKAAAKEEEPAGNICVTLRWPDEARLDIDQWVVGPDGAKIGYSNKSGELFDLLRDDLGATADISGRNEEMTCSRGVLPGRYVMNAFWFSYGYGNMPEGQPMPAEVYVRVRKDDSSSLQEIRMHMDLPGPRREVTMVQFDIDEKLQIDGDSINQVFSPIFTTGQ